MIRENGMWLDQADRSEFARVGRSLLGSNTLLSVESTRLGVKRRQLKPKHHALKHSLKYAARSGRNPGSHYTFKMRTL